MRVAFRQSLYSSQDAMASLDNRAHNPYGPCGIVTVSRFLSDPATTTILEKLLVLTTWPAKPYETLPDGTGLTEQLFSAYFDERYRRKKRKKQSKTHYFGGFSRSGDAAARAGRKTRCVAGASATVDGSPNSSSSVRPPAAAALPLA